VRTVLIALALLATAAPAFAEVALGPRFGLMENDEAFLGVQAEFSPIFRRASLVFDADFGLGSGKPNLIDADLRLPLVPLPETGLMFYGQAGPTWQVSPDGEFGLSVGLGLIVPMKETRRYNFEYRWGFGDVPDHRVSVTVMFGL
jgi:hypothetical protein